jgi:hypothetical protein
MNASPAPSVSITVIGSAAIRINSPPLYTSAATPQCYDHFRDTASMKIPDHLIDLRIRSELAARDERQGDEPAQQPGKLWLFQLTGNPC